ncbi:hypothetical protein [Mesorhizobium sangaii]|uniref:Secreted protein n=1 Tax=Mesorhizobium sangaii TaxID=505389 RepID=A0A841PIS3_9HYPH|nr:hypothetical protein [Mesorhizobium sangaii]MBB6413523.1 hypothetical protein [Mesorhizobium sangaii]
MKKRIPLCLAAATAALLLTGTAQAAQPNPAALGMAYRHLDDLCRGGSGDDPATDKACDQRNVVSAQMRKLFNLCVLTAEGDFEDCSKAPSPSADDEVANTPSPPDIDNGFTVTKYQDRFGGWDLTFTVRGDELAINRVAVNRNNCPIQQRQWGAGERMKFGEQIRFTTLCEPIELSIDTDQGHSVVGWDGPVDPSLETTAAPVETHDDTGAFWAQKYTYYGAWHLLLTLHDDNATITGVTVNHGNCAIYNPSNAADRKMRFGQQFDIVPKCDPIAVSIQTATGTQEITWGQ